MITPAVLISACGTLVLSTSARLARVIDRVRQMSERADDLEEGKATLPDYDSRRATLLHQMRTLARRGRLLQFSLTLFYLGVAIFVATSVAIGLVAAGWTRVDWIPVVLALTGALMLLAGSLVLIAESRIALMTTLRELVTMEERT
jgi:uncharacterized membrane protein YcjF (UPF0283 family)